MGKTKIVVIDGMGGGIGAEIIARLKPLCEGGAFEIIALGANSTATERMLRAGAQRGATGENAICVSSSLGDYILGPIGIVIADSMMGEITAAMARAVLAAKGKRILLPLQNEHFCIAGYEPVPLGKQLDEAIRALKGAMKNGGKGDDQA
jgi:hypothetical protein